MNTTNIRRSLSGAALLLVAACGSATANNSSGGGGSAPQPASASVTVSSATISGHGLVLVGGSNGMTLYMFDMDVPGSNTSACTAQSGCITTWPPLTVPAGTTPTASSGITGQLSMFTRPDGHGIQVTYNGHPLHFYSGDTKPGDANGNYPHWSSVPVTSGGAAAPTATPAGGASPSNPYGY